MSVADEENLVGYQSVTVEYTEWGEYVYFATFIVSFGYRAKPTLNVENDLVLERLYADGKVIYNRATNTWSPNVAGWYFKPGTEDQMPTITGGLAYRGQMLVHFVNFNLKEYADRIPAISAEFSEGVTTLAEAMVTLSIRAGFPEENVITSRLDDRVIQGYIIGQTATLEQIAAGLGTLFNFTVAEVGAFIQYTSPYDGGTVVVDATLTEDMLAVLNEGRGDDQQVIVTQRQSDQSFPRKLSATYFNMANNFEADTQTAERHTVPLTQSSDTNASLQLPLVSTGQEMRSLLHDALYRTWASKNSHSIRVPPEFLKYDVGEVFRVQVYGGDYVVSIVRTLINGDFSSSLSLTELSADYVASEVETQPTVIRPPIVTVGEVTAVVCDIPDITEATLLPGFLNLRVAMGNPDPDTVWRGGQFDMAPVDNPTNWAPRITTPNESGLGQIDVLIDPIDDVEGFDMVTELHVALNNFPMEDFETVDPGDLADGVTNLLIFGQPNRFELIQYTTATPDGDDHVVLTGLKRGLYGTELTVNSHNSGDYIVRYDQTTIVTYRVEDFRAKRDYLGRAYAVGGRPNPDLTFAIHFSGNSRKPMAPINLTADRLDNGDVLFNWERRSRYFQSPQDGVGQPLDEDAEVYEIEVWTDDWSRRLRRNLNLRDGSNFRYYIEEQIIDGNNLDDEYAFMVWQMNSTHVGRGFTGADHVSVGAPVTLKGTAGPIVGATGHIKGFLEQQPFNIVGGTGHITTAAALRGTAGPVRGGSGYLNRTGLKGSAGPIVGATGNILEYVYTPPEYISHDTATEEGPGATSITIPAPADIQEGDFLLAFVANNFAANQAQTDWDMGDGTAGTISFGVVQGMTRIADASDVSATDYTFTYTGAGGRLMGIVINIRYVSAYSWGTGFLDTPSAQGVHNIFFTPGNRTGDMYVGQLIGGDSDTPWDFDPATDFSELAELSVNGGVNVLSIMMGTYPADYFGDFPSSEAVHAGSGGITLTGNYVAVGEIDGDTLALIWPTTDPPEEAVTSAVGTAANGADVDIVAGAMEFDNTMGQSWSFVAADVDMYSIHTNWTCEFHADQIAGNESVIVGRGVSAGDGARWIVYSPGDGSLQLYVNNSAMVCSAAGMLDGSMHHFAIVKTGNDYEWFKDGVSIATNTDATVATTTNGDDLMVGGDPRVTPGTFPDRAASGLIGRVKLSDVARYTAGFTPPDITDS